MVDAIILAGGLGTRLKPSVPDLPKALALIQTVPFLQLLLAHLAKSGIVSRVVLALGYRAESIQDFIATVDMFPFPIEVSVESTPLGTGGAIIHALSKTTSKSLLVLNGDTFFDLPMEEFYNFHQIKNGELAIACRHVKDCSRYGSIVFDAAHQISRFTEKSTKLASGWISGGVYLIKRDLFSLFPSGTYSLENDFFPQFLKKSAFAYPHSGTFIDIGTPSSYEEAQVVLQPWI